MRRVIAITAAKRRTRDEAGFSLVEFVITISLMAGVTAIASSIFVAGLRGDRQVHTTTQATMQAQSIAQGIEKSVRNAKRIDISILGSTLTVWTTLGDSRNCQRWSIAGSGEDATVQFAQSDTTLASGADTTFAGTAAIKGATLELVDASADGKAGVTYTLTLPSETRPVKVAGTVRSRTAQDTTTTAGSAPCGL